MKDFNIRNSDGDLIRRMGPIMHGLDAAISKVLKYTIKSDELHFLEITLKDSSSVYWILTMWKHRNYIIASKQNFNYVELGSDELFENLSKNTKDHLLGMIRAAKWEVNENTPYTKIISFLEE